MGRYAEFAKTLPTVPDDWGKVPVSGSVAKFKRKKFASYEAENRDFYARLGDRHFDSKPYLATVRNAVAKQSFFRSRPRSVSKSISGVVLGSTCASIEVRRSLAVADANRALLDVDERLVRNDLRLSWDDRSICDWAETKAAQSARIAETSEYPLFDIETLVESYGFELPPHDLFGASAAVARACDPKWWRRQARVAKVRTIDQIARDFRMVHAMSQTYCSNEAVRLRRAQARRNRMTLEGFEAVNQEGDRYTLAELSDLSVSNPTNRRHELMVRMRGFEEIADQFGHKGLFVTMNCPSRFHPMKQIKNRRGRLVRVEENKNYLDCDPRPAQAWLCKTWAMIRAEFAREEIRCYGFRVAEPHHDGCPHWHQLLFFRASDIPAVKLIFKRYILRTDTFEDGAGYRLRIVDIDKAKGSAAGYIAKYISKSIDGSHIDDDLFGNKGYTAAERICAWASSWGIRQFQQIGGASVTVWRELRRLDAAEGVTERARVAADASDWAAYILVQGNGQEFFGRNDQQIRPAYRIEVDYATGEILDKLVNKYGEESKGRLFGVEAVFECKNFVSRIYRWTVQRVSAIGKAIKKALPVSSLSADELLDLMRGDGLGATA